MFYCTKKRLLIRKASKFFKETFVKMISSIMHKSTLQYLFGKKCSNFKLQNNFGLLNPFSMMSTWHFTTYLSNQGTCTVILMLKGMWHLHHDLNIETAM